MRPRICIIGAGSVAPFHIEAAKGAGFELFAICARPNSKRAMNLYEKYSFKKYLSDTKQIYDLKPDAISIVTSTDSLLDVYQTLCPLNVPILIEKPVAPSIYKFPEAIDLDNKKTIVGYNRRFYSSVQSLKSKLGDFSQIQSSWVISELSNFTKCDMDSRTKAIRENSVHILDLLAYLFGEIDNLQIERQFDSYGIKFISTLMRFKFGSIATVNINFNTPGLYEGKIYTTNSMFKLKPIEKFNQFTGIKTVEPTVTSTTRLYKPFGPDWEIHAKDIEFKPGFFKQYMELKNLVLGEPKAIGASLRDAKNAAFLAEMLLGTKPGIETINNTQ
jgi:predicted dehydrogenase